MKLRRRTLAAQVRQLKEQLAAVDSPSRKALREKVKALTANNKLLSARINEQGEMVTSLVSQLEEAKRELADCQAAAAMPGAGAGAPRKEGA